jgi:signal transduction histidine kinase
MQPKGVGILGLLLHRTEPLRIKVLSEHPSSIGFPPNHPPMSSFLGVPIRRDNLILGSLYITNKIGDDHFTEDDEIAVAALGAHAAVAIHNLHMLQRQRALLSGLINAQEEERRAIAYDLHDGLTQYVMASHMHIDAFRKAHESGNITKAERDFQRGMQYLKEAVVESRRLVNGLRSLALDDLGLSGALEQLFTEEKSRAGWDDAELAHNIADRRFDKSLETAVYRVVQEALTNIRKHAQTDKVRVLLLLSPDDKPGGHEITLEIRDWGRGFSPEERIADTSHVGLQGMAERINLIGGRYYIDAAVGEGCCIRAIIPIIDTSHTSNLSFPPLEAVNIPQ